MKVITTEIPGLFYIKEYITWQEHDYLLTIIDQQNWLKELKRRVQHYGYHYNYKSRAVDDSTYLGSLPSWVNFIIENLSYDKLIEPIPDQLIINEYMPGQGIAAHIDSVTSFDKTILSLSLGSSYIMDFINAYTNEQAKIVLEPRSLIIMQGEARYSWKHGIAARKTDDYLGQVSSRGRRVSLTFRKIIR